MMYSHFIINSILITIGSLYYKNNIIIDAKCSQYGPCNKIDMISSLSATDLGWPKETMCTSIWGWVDERQIPNKRYVVLSCEPGHSLIDVTDETRPRAIGKIMGENGGVYRWRDVKIYKNHAYMVSDALLSRVQVLNLEAAVDGLATSTYKIPDDYKYEEEEEEEEDDDTINFDKDDTTFHGNNNNSSNNEYENENENENDDEYTPKLRRNLRTMNNNNKRNLLPTKKISIYKPTTVYYGGGIFQSHNIEINEESGFAYAVGGGNNCNNGLHMIDIRNPGYPVFAGCFYDGKDQYIHDAHCRSYTNEHLDGKYAGKEICFAFSPYTVMIIDVTDKKNVKLLSKLHYDGASYVHQGWLTTDRNFLVVDDERDAPGAGIKTFIVDVRDLENPKLAHIHVAVGETFGDHNQYVVPIGEHDYTFQANYRGGLRVLRIVRGEVPKKGLTDEILRMEEVAYFDANPGSNSDMDGVWSVYPYFTDDRLVMMADMETGFYIVKWNFEDTDSAIPYKGVVGATPSPTSWSNCGQIQSSEACNDEIACIWDIDWEVTTGWTSACYFKPTGSVKPIQPYRSPPGGASRGCPKLNRVQCNSFPGCIFNGGKCKAFTG